MTSTTQILRSRNRRQVRVIYAQWLIILALIAALATVILIRWPAGARSITQAPAATIAPAEQEDALPAAVPEATPEPCPITQDEIIMLAKTLFAESNVLQWSGDQYGVSYKARQAAVAWIALNRYDSGEFGDTLAEVLSAPYQFAYSPDTEVTTEMLDLASDVVSRWWAEKQGEADVGRTLPADYYFFHGDGLENHFRKEYQDTGVYWNWSLADPYQ